MPDAPVTTTPAVVQVTLLTQADCAMCDHAKTVLARVGADHPLHITEIGLATDEGRRLALEAGVLFAPGVLLDGKPFAYGRLSERKLRRTLTTP
ncbi:MULTISPECIES: glutaredoxin family protein [Streptomycetaceae]|uniref:Glutaredoxin 2 n=1 Tax=Streptantibioticus cattleyicolor (strain ATCC 35852 / DSM 46488 / JCM 4925 / NBRC 14057 / NRRL 8057) TaxID=1003195 RepID=F8K4G0_STREN|nr:MULTISPECIES: glutaredoxin family protein [Streptomycetaceae]AEW95114.1 glutaredoxin 2 [Streptantibioticus cattleyicolor NRRL 8057 = DSM 46488]MYS59703.1 thioredoxin family protein [Streptomyces sp. SID5468]CCB75461.1 Glutaredoxin 2 [Streptantibioticus cattleyicolor NRRL 8057 = DSM 46488]